MTPTNFDDYLVENARLVILKELSQQTDYRLNETMLGLVLDRFGHRRSRDWLRTQLLKLQELGAVKMTEAGSVMVPALTQLGLAHVERREVIAGVARPSPEA